jgi:hypothetical protein
VMDIPVRMRQIRTNNQNGESQIGLARQARSTRRMFCASAGLKQWAA